MSVFLSPVGGAGAQFFDNSGNVLTGGKLYTYAAGTTTPQATYTSSAGSTFHANPIVLDAAGRVPSGGEIWLADSQIYKFVLKDSNDVLLATWDQLTGVNSNFVNYTAETELQTATSGQTVFTLTIMSYQPATGSLTVYVDGVNQYEGESYFETNSTTVTFVSGLHVGAEVKFTTAVQTTGNAVDASVVTYDPPFTGGVPTTVEDKLAQTVSVKDFGAVCNGVADDTAAFSAAIDSVIVSNKTLFVTGELNLNTWVVKAISGTLNILGENQSTKIIGNTSNLLSLADGSIFSAKSIAFEDIGQLLVLSGTANYPLIEMIGVKYTNSGPVVSTGCLDVDTLRVQDCEFDSVTDSCFSMSSYIKHAVVTGNKFTNLSSATSSCSALVLGKTQLVDQPLTGNYIVADNLFENIIAGGSTAGEVHAMLLYGDRATITGNIVKNIDRPLAQQSGGVEGIYTKTANTTITGNVLFNAGFAEGNKGAMINVKGDSHNSTSGRPLGINHVVSNNTIGCDDALARNGIRLETDYAAVVGNTFEGLNGTFAIGVAWPNDGSEGLIVSNNVITNSTLVTAGIWLNTVGKKIRVNDNVIANDALAGGFDGAILWTDASRLSGSMDDICIDNNIINGAGWDYGIIFNNDTGRDLSNIRVFDNKITGTVYGIRTNNPTRILSGEIRRNQMVGVSVPYRDKAIDTVRYVDNTNDNLNIDARTAAPTTGTWKVGEIVYSSQPATTGFIGWVCTVAGTPGTWKTFGAVTP